MALSIVTKLITQNYGSSGIITLAAVVGIVDVDPFILSLVGDGNVSIGIISAAMIIAMMSNTIMKGVYFGYFVPTYRKDVVLKYGLLTLAHVPLIILNLLM